MLGPIGLGEHTSIRFIAHARRITRGKDNACRWPDLPCSCGKIPPRHAGKIDIRYQHVNRQGFKRGHRLFATADIDHHETGILKNFRRIHPNQRVIFNQKNGQWRLYVRCSHSRFRIGDPARQPLTLIGQNMPEFPCQRLFRIGLGQKLDACIQLAAMHDGIFGIA